MLVSKKYKQNGLDISPLLLDTDQQLMWQYVSMAKFLNMSYEDVKELPFDELSVLTRLKQISDYASTEQGQDILKDNIRYMETKPDVTKLRDKYGEEG